MSIKKTAFEKLKGQLKNSYQSTFNFGSYEINDDIKERVIEKEAIITSSFEKYSKSQYEICKALYEVALELKAEGSFMAWYSHIGLTKDKVSELLKRYEIFIQLPGKEVYVSSLSTQAIKLLTRKDFDIDYLLEIGDLELKKVEDIRNFLANKEFSEDDDIPEEISKEIEHKPVSKIDFNELIDYENTIKTTKDISQVKSYKKQIHKLKAKLLELEKLCDEKIESSANDSNLKLC